MGSHRGSSVIPSELEALEKGNYLILLMMIEKKIEDTSIAVLKLKLSKNNSLFQYLQKLLTTPQHSCHEDTPQFTL